MKKENFMLYRKCYPVKQKYDNGTLNKVIEKG